MLDALHTILTHRLPTQLADGDNFCETTFLMVAHEGALGMARI